ncbi:MAG TPA: hypothetical protein DIU07_13150, partial [Rhodobacteraceae bacterium]|nr:hypothetical protein [Paracoccaceae bacterium]
SFNLNFWYANLVFDEFNNDANENGYEDNYHLYTDTSDALSLYGSGFDYSEEDMFFGSIQALSQWAWVPDDSLVDEGYYRERWHWEGWDDYEMQAFWIVGQTPETDDDLVLIKEVMSGEDTIYLSRYDDQINGFDDRDTIYGKQGNDLLLGGNGHDDLYGGRGNDKLKGLDGNDYLNGSSGADIFRGGRGRDEIFGGGGEDTFRFQTGDEKDVIVDFDATGVNHDVVDLSGLASITGWNDLKNNHMTGDHMGVLIDGGNGDV